MCLRRALVLAAALGADAFTPGSREHALARWVESEGGFVGDVACGEREGVRGLYATKDVPKGTLLLSVPEACCISADEDPQWGLSLRELTTARLVGSRTRGEHEPYIATLPSDEPLLCDWSDAELAAHAFRDAGLGPIVGTRTWGGLLTVAGGGARLVDGGWVSFPSQNVVAFEEGVARRDARIRVRGRRDATSRRDGDARDGCARHGVE